MLKNPYIALSKDVKEIKNLIKSLNLLLQSKWLTKKDKKEYNKVKNNLILLITINKTWKTKQKTKKKKLQKKKYTQEQQKRTQKTAKLLMKTQKKALKNNLNIKTNMIINKFGENGLGINQILQDNANKNKWSVNWKNNDTINTIAICDTEEEAKAFANKLLSI